MLTKRNKNKFLSSSIFFFFFFFGFDVSHFPIFPCFSIYNFILYFNILIPFIRGMIFLCVRGDENNENVIFRHSKKGNCRYVCRQTEAEHSHL